ncbi:copper amine oxidase N-terminal domain-containing protein [Paenibacillus wynnii]|uniref:Copper amine oxidase-like N-terminal domain-containing protein n=1 Tax=Paenibacillus wynnii TaxID=268407 RepID=A0A098M646_9BACL|nr:copper amine oxidase N-terminal domain-containing protein [Paenibacillus wynnii]KGE18040.1 hypothetical protein PWYN_26205 [Paenibacillus wynnii]
MKGFIRLTRSLVVMLAAVFLFVGTVEAAGHQTIWINYLYTTMSNSAIVINGTTWVPLKKLASDMSFNLTFEAATRSITLIRPGQQAKFQMGSKSGVVNGKSVSLSNSIRIIKNTAHVPLVSMVRALGATPLFEKESGNLQIVDKPRFVSLSKAGRTYWVSQESGELYRMLPTSAKPEMLSKFPIKPRTSGSLSIKQVSKDTDLVLLHSRYISMFNEFDNSYQALISKDTVVKQMEYHYVGQYFKDQYGSKISSTQIYMTDGLNVQYINQDGTLGKLYELEKSTENKGPFLVEYATPKILLVRSTSTTALVAMNLIKGTSENLTQTLIPVENRKEWDRADPNDPYVLSRMLRLQADDGKELTFTFTTLITDKANKERYKYAE